MHFCTALYCIKFQQKINNIIMIIKPFRTHTSIGSILLFIISLSVSYLHAQVYNQEQPIDTTKLEPVVVVGYKEATQLNNISKSIVLISESLQYTQSKDLSQTLNEAGVIASGAYSNLGYPKSLFLRGAASKYTLLTMDGIPLQDPGSLGAADLRYYIPSNLQSIEILQGGASTLYGSNAIAGVVNLRTQELSKTRRLQVHAAGGNLGTWNVNLKRERVFYQGNNIRLGYTGNIGYVNSSGINEVRSKEAKPTNERDRFGQLVAQVGLDFSYNNRLSIRPYIQHSRLRTQLDGGAFTDENGYTYSGDFTMINLLSKWRISPQVQLQGKFSRQDYLRLFEREFPEKSMFKSNGLFHYGELIGHYKPWRNLRALAGVAYTHENALEHTVTTYSPYVVLHTRLPIHTNLRMELGGRLNIHSAYGNNLTYHINPFYLLQERYKFFGTFSTSFRAPDLSSLYGRFGPNPDLKPERATNWEVGVEQLEGKQDLRLQWRVAYFQRIIKDLIVYEVTDSITFAGINKNRDSQHDRGAEIQSTISWKNKVQLGVTYGYVDGFGKVITTDPTTQISVTNQRYNLTRRPHHSYRLNATYNPLPALTLRAHLQGYSARTDRDFAQSTTLTLSPYALVDAYVSYAFPRFLLFLDLKNILNSSNHVEAHGYQVTGTRFMIGIQLNLNNSASL